MILSLEHLRSLFEKYGAGLTLKYFDDIIIRGNAFLPFDIILPDHIERLRDNGIKEVNVVYNDELYQKLSHDFESDFRKPYRTLNFTMFDRYLEELKNTGGLSRRKRFVYMVGDYYGFDSESGKKVIRLKHNEALDYKKWNYLKIGINRGDSFHFRNSETAIIIFVDLSIKNGPYYIERFKKNTDLISIMVQKKMNINNFIAPDFIPTEDVISVTEPRNLLKEYIRTNARLIIIGENLNENYKKALIEVRKYDRFVRMLVVPELNQRNLDHFFRQVKLVYNTNKWE